MPVIEVTHPLVRHKVGLLRDASLSTKSFREITAELGRLLTYEATADFPLESVLMECWSGPVRVDRISGKKVTVVPILRAGLGMLEGVLDTIPNAKVSVVGIARNHATLMPEPYVDRLAGSLSARTAIVLDPMLATGGSMNSAIALLKSRGATDIRALVLVAAPEGIAALTAARIPTCAAGRRRSTTTSTPTATSSRALATPATGSSEPADCARSARS